MRARRDVPSPRLGTATVVFAWILVAAGALSFGAAGSSGDEAQVLPPNHKFSTALEERLRNASANESLFWFGWTSIPT